MSAFYRTQWFVIVFTKAFLDTTESSPQPHTLSPEVASTPASPK
jgi:hypothetical protein